jgi:hypothetical protein
MAEKLTIAEWSATHRMSRQAGYQAVKRCGIPVDADGRVDRRVADLLYKERTRYRYKPPPRQPAAAEPVDLLELAEDIAEIMARDDGALMDEGLPYLHAVVHAMDDEMLLRVRLPVAVVEAIERAADA